MIPPPKRSVSVGGVGVRQGRSTIDLSSVSSSRQRATYVRTYVD